MDVVRAGGAWGVGLLMLLENVFPPIPSELIMPLAGYLSAAGGLGFWPALLAGSAGSLGGATLWYLLGRRLGPERLAAWVGRSGAWVALTPEDVQRATRWFERHGRASVFLCRLLPFLRTVISVPAGVAGMPLLPFLAYSGAGSLLWAGALAWAGRLLGSRFPQVEGAVGWVSWAVIAAATVWYVWGVSRVRRKRAAAREGNHPLEPDLRRRRPPAVPEPSPHPEDRP